MSTESKLPTGFAFLIALSCSSCDNRQLAVSIDGHTFVVPRDHLIQPHILWLPESQREGLMFILNPSDSPPEQVIVLAQESGQVCGGAANSAYLNSMCREPMHAEETDYRDRLMKEPLQGNDIESFYVDKDHPGTYVASCVSSPSKSPELGDMCSSIGEYKNLRYTIRFRESAIENLPELAKNANALLRSWEQ